MNISSGLSTISLNGANGAERAYLWPTYNKGEVEPVARVKNTLVSNVYYSKPSPEREAEIVDIIMKRSDSFYSKEGSAYMKNVALAPAGNFFDALA